MRPFRLIHPPRRMSKTLVWTHLPISPLGPLLNRLVGQHGLLCHRVKTKHLADLRTLSFLLFMTPRLVAALTYRTTLSAPGPSPSHVLLVSPPTWTPHRCVSLLSLSPSSHLRWSRQCGTVNTSPPRTPSLLRLRGLLPRRLLTYLTPGHAHHLVQLKRAGGRRFVETHSPTPLLTLKQLHPPLYRHPPIAKTETGNETAVSRLLLLLMTPSQSQ